MFATEQGLRWFNAPIAIPGGWRSDFNGQNVTAIAMRSRRDVWVVADRRLKRMTVNVFGTTVSTSDFGQPCNLFGFWTDLQFAPNGDFWLVSPPPSGGDDVNVPNPAICRHLAGTPPGAGNLLTPNLGNGGRDVSVDGDGRIWVAVASHFGQSGGLVAYENVAGGLRTSEFNWLNAPIAGLSLVNPGGTGINNWDSGLRAVAGIGERVVVGRSDGLLAALTQRWQQFSESNALGQVAIEGVWLGRGRAFLAGATTLHVLQPDGLTWDNRSGVHARALLADQSGRIWVGTDTDVRLYSATGWDLLADAEGTPPGGPVLALAEDRGGRIWIGGAGGLTLFDRDRFVATFTTANSGLPANEVRALLVDRDDVLWVGTPAGLARFDGAAWTTHTTANGLPDNAIHSLVQPGDGSLAVSTANGLSLYANGVYSPTTPPDGSVNLPLAVDELGRLWAGGAVLTASGWQNYTPNNSGLRAAAVSAIAADGAGPRLVWSRARGRRQRARRLSAAAGRQRAHPQRRCAGPGQRRRRADDQRRRLWQRQGRRGGGDRRRAARDRLGERQRHHREADQPQCQRRCCGARQRSPRHAGKRFLRRACGQWLYAHRRQSGRLCGDQRQQLRPRRHGEPWRRAGAFRQPPQPRTDLPADRDRRRRGQPGCHKPLRPQRDGGWRVPHHRPRLATHRAQPGHSQRGSGCGQADPGAALPESQPTDASNRRHRDRPGSDHLFGQRQRTDAHHSLRPGRAHHRRRADGRDAQIHRSQRQRGRHADDLWRQTFRCERCSSVLA
jgi:hypothetical protein